VAWAEGEVQRLVDGPHFEMPGAEYQHLPNDLKEDTYRQDVQTADIRLLDGSTNSHQITVDNKNLPVL
jgi:hypothetical protein